MREGRAQTKPKILLHICCAPDSTAVFEMLCSRYAVTGYFHNPNIYPLEEYQKRSSEARKAALKMGFPLVVPSYKPEEWNKRIKGLEHEPEKGLRCEICFRFNLWSTARKAREMHIPNFTTTLTISPHKDSNLIIRIGKAVGEEFGVNFLDIDFKKKHGFQRSLELSREWNLYRQNYCGCRYSMRIAK